MKDFKIDSIMYTVHNTNERLKFSTRNVSIKITVIRKRNNK